MIAWLGHASFRIAAPQQVYLDPYAVKKGSPPADLILVTHGHEHHFSPPDITKILQPSTLILCNASVYESLGPLKCRARVVRPHDKTEAKGIPVESLPACTPGRPSRAEGSCGLGFLVRVADTAVYHAGDTGFFPEMQDIRCDIALLPVSGAGVMTAPEAAEAARALSPRLAIPMHYGSFSGTITEARVFCSLCQEKGIAVKLLTPP
ncbi:MAG: MBL fold metallo-hydrolase [Endomicrobiales bacterium]